MNNFLEENIRAIRQAELRKLEAKQNNRKSEFFCGLGNHHWWDWGWEKELQIRPCESCLNNNAWLWYNRSYYRA